LGPRNRTVASRIDSSPGEASRRLTWLAQDEGRAVGMMNLVVFERMPRPGPDPGRWGYLANAYVRPDYRNQGIGARLVDAILTYADDRGFARVVLSPSQRAIPFYRRAGFGPADALLSRERRGCAHNGTATGDSGLNPGVLPPAAVSMWADRTAHELVTFWLLRVS
jgi:GNAT superfamily N-acetyltransferase